MREPFLPPHVALVSGPGILLGQGSSACGQADESQVQQVRRARACAGDGTVGVVEAEVRTRVLRPFLISSIIKLMEDSQKVTYFAETDSRGERKPFGIRDGDRTKHFYVIGKSGMGKSTLLENIAVQDIQRGHGLCFIDPHGGTAEKLLEYIPEDRIKDVLYFAPFDMEYPVSFNIMEDVGADKRHLVVNGLMSVFEKIWEDAWSARMAYILQNTLLALLEYPGATLLAVNRMYTDKAFRQKVVENISDVSVKSFWVEEYAKYTDKYAAEATPAIQNKIGQFAGNPLIRNMIGQPKSSFDIRKIMDEKKIMIVNLSKGRVGEGNGRLLGSMFITKIYLAAMSRADESAASLAKLPPFYLFVDEFQSFADKSFADILSEARKYKLSLTIAHQYIEQMEEEVRDAVFGNVGTMVSFRVGAYDADVLEKEFAPVFLAEDIVNLGRFQMYLKLMIDNVTSQPFSANALPPIALPEKSYIKEIIESSRKQFARLRSLVEKEIIEWHDAGKGDAGAEVSPGMTKYKPRATPYVKSEPKAIDTRSLSMEKPVEVKKVPKPVPVVLPAAPKVTPPPRPIQPRPQPVVPKISLETLKNKTNNQRPPDEKNVSALRDALKAVVGEKPTTNNSQLTTNPIKSTSEPKLEASSKKLEANSGPSPEDLMKILNG